jgi:hypothetical protein
MQKTLKTQISLLDRKLDAESADMAARQQRLIALQADLKAARTMLERERRALADASRRDAHLTAFSEAFFAKQDRLIAELIRDAAEQERLIDVHRAEIRALFGEKEKYRILLERKVQEAKSALEKADERQRGESLQQRSYRQRGE